MESIEEWGRADDRVIQCSYTAGIYISCAWITYGMDAHCHACVGCALVQAMLEQGQDLTNSCRICKAVHKMGLAEVWPHAPKSGSGGMISAWG